MASEEQIGEFIARWRPSGGSERSNYALFLSELCDLLEVPRPDPAKPENELNDYVIDRAVRHIGSDGTETPGFIDLYKRDCFVLETKQGVEAEEAKNPVTELKKKKRKKGHGVRGTRGWETTMLKARGQAGVQACVQARDRAGIARIRLIGRLFPRFGTRFGRRWCSGFFWHAQPVFRQTRSSP